MPAPSNRRIRPSHVFLGALGLLAALFALRPTLRPLPPERALSFEPAILQAASRVAAQAVAEPGSVTLEPVSVRAEFWPASPALETGIEDAEPPPNCTAFRRTGSGELLRTCLLDEDLVAAR